MTGQIRSTRVPWFVPFFNPIARRLLAAGVPMGPNVLITVAGRKSGLPPIALTLFAERGVENVGIKDLAVEADVAQGLIYYYFQSKDELSKAVMKRHNPLPQVQALIDQLSDLPAHNGLLLFAQRVAALLPEKRLILRLLVHELLSPRFSLLAQGLPLREEARTQLAQYLLPYKFFCLFY